MKKELFKKIFLITFCVIWQVGSFFLFCRGGSDYRFALFQTILFIIPLFFLLIGYGNLFCKENDTFIEKLLWIVGGEFLFLLSCFGVIAGMMYILETMMHSETITNEIGDIVETVCCMLFALAIIFAIGGEIIKFMIKFSKKASKKLNKNKYNFSENINCIFEKVMKLFEKPFIKNLLAMLVVVIAIFIIGFLLMAGFEAVNNGIMNYAVLKILITFSVGVIAVATIVIIGLIQCTNPKSSGDFNANNPNETEEYSPYTYIDYLKKQDDDFLKEYFPDIWAIKHHKETAFTNEVSAITEKYFNETDISSFGKKVKMVDPLTIARYKEFIKNNLTQIKLFLRNYFEKDALIFANKYMILKVYIHDFLARNCLVEVTDKLTFQNKKICFVRPKGDNDESIFELFKNIIETFSYETRLEDFLYFLKEKNLMYYDAKIRTVKKLYLDINQASEAELTSLPGVTIARAKHAIKVRNNQKLFLNMQQFFDTINLEEEFIEQIHYKGNKVFLNSLPEYKGFQE